jgi:Zn-finger nucleic acid-binding protein
MKCPKCDGTLIKVKVRTQPGYGDEILHPAELEMEMEVDQCLLCNGVWFDANELQEYLAEKLMILDSPKVSAYAELNKKEGICPKCNCVMVKQSAPMKAGFMIDVCNTCKGIWLDGSELERLEDKSISWKEKNILVLSHLGSVIKEFFGRS